MRSTLLLATFLSVIPHISATPFHVETVRQVDTTLVPFVDLFINNTWNFQGCISSEKLNVIGKIPGALATLTIFNCVNACDGERFTQAGIGGGQLSGFGNQCTCGNTTTVDSLSLTQCKQMGCPGALDEACGSPTSQVYYLKNQN